MTEDTVFKAQVGGRTSGGLLPLLLIGAGLLLLVSNTLRLELMEYLWPGFVIGLGLLLTWPAYRSTPNSRRRFSFLAVPGAMLIAQGVLLFSMNLVNHFESMAYAWTLVLAAGAAGWMYSRRFDKERGAQVRGYRFIRFMAILFLGLAILFEVLAFGSLGQWWPLALIGYGLFLFLRQYNRKSV